MAEPPVILPPSIDEVPPPGLALVEELDKLLMVQMRDGRKIIGILRSFDQFANLVLEGELRGAAALCGGAAALCVPCCTAEVERQAQQQQQQRPALAGAHPPAAPPTRPPPQARASAS